MISGLEYERNTHMESRAMAGRLCACRRLIYGFLAKISRHKLWKLQWPDNYIIEIVNKIQRANHFENAKTIRHVCECTKYDRRARAHAVIVESWNHPFV